MGKKKHQPSKPTPKDQASAEKKADKTAASPRATSTAAPSVPPPEPVKIKTLEELRREKELLRAAQATTQKSAPQLSTPSPQAKPTPIDQPPAQAAAAPVLPVAEKAEHVPISGATNNLSTPEDVLMGIQQRALKRRDTKRLPSTSTQRAGGPGAASTPPTQPPPSNTPAIIASSSTARTSDPPQQFATADQRLPTPRLAGPPSGSAPGANGRALAEDDDVLVIEAEAADAFPEPMETETGRSDALEPVRMQAKRAREEPDAVEHTHKAPRESQQPPSRGASLSVDEQILDRAIESALPPGSPAADTRAASRSESVTHATHQSASDRGHRTSSTRPNEHPHRSASPRDRLRRSVSPQSSRTAPRAELRDRLADHSLPREGHRADHRGGHHEHRSGHHDARGGRQELHGPGDRRDTGRGLDHRDDRRPTRNDRDDRRLTGNHRDNERPRPEKRIRSSSPVPVLFPEVVPGTPLSEGRFLLCQLVGGRNFTSEQCERTISALLTDFDLDGVVKALTHIRDQLPPTSARAIIQAVSTLDRTFAALPLALEATRLAIDRLLVGETFPPSAIEAVFGTVLALEDPPYPTLCSIVNTLRVARAITDPLLLMPLADAAAGCAALCREIVKVIPESMNVFEVLPGLFEKLMAGLATQASSPELLVMLFDRLVDTNLTAPGEAIAALFDCIMASQNPEGALRIVRSCSRRHETAIPLFRDEHMLAILSSVLNSRAKSRGRIKPLVEVALIVFSRGLAVPDEQVRGVIGMSTAEFAMSTVQIYTMIDKLAKTCEPLSQETREQLFQFFLTAFGAANMRPPEHALETLLRVADKMLELHQAVAPQTAVALTNLFAERKRFAMCSRLLPLLPEDKAETLLGTMSASAVDAGDIPAALSFWTDHIRRCNTLPKRAVERVLAAAARHRRVALFEEMLPVATPLMSVQAFFELAMDVFVDESSWDCAKAAYSLFLCNEPLLAELSTAAHEFLATNGKDSGLDVRDIPSMHVFSKMLFLAHTTSRWQDVFGVHKDLVERGFPFTSKHVSLITRSLEKHNLPLAVEAYLLVAARRPDAVPDTSTMLSLLRRCADARAPGALEDLVKLTVASQPFRVRDLRRSEIVEIFAGLLRASRADLLVEALVNHPSLFEYGDFMKVFDSVLEAHDLQAVRSLLLAMKARKPASPAAYVKALTACLERCDLLLAGSIFSEMAELKYRAEPELCRRLLEALLHTEEPLQHLAAMETVSAAWMKAVPCSGIVADAPWTLRTAQLQLADFVVLLGLHRLQLHAKQPHSLTIRCEDPVFGSALAAALREARPPLEPRSFQDNFVYIDADAVKAWLGAGLPEAPVLAEDNHAPSFHDDSTADFHDDSTAGYHDSSAGVHHNGGTANHTDSQTPASPFSSAVRLSPPGSGAVASPFEGGPRDPADTPVSPYSSPNAAWSPPMRTDDGEPRSSNEELRRRVHRDTVVKQIRTHLNPYYKASRIPSKEEFKRCARKLTHNYLADDSKLLLTPERLLADTEAFVHQFFQRHRTYSSSSLRKQSRGD
eukprot:m.85526 g.85526  ORF g.85526 m.85526 type:complete len:1532 (+) comp8245_c3_seq1:18-4613(+)